MAQPPEFEVAGLLFGGIVLMLALALALVFFFVFHQKRIIRQQVKLQQLQASYQKALLTAAIQAEEKERKRIGSDLHDEIGSALSAARLLISQVAASATGADNELVAAARSILDDSIQDIRTVSKNLYPVVLARLGLAEALRNLGSVWNAALPDGLTVTVAMTAQLPYDHELALYRIVQELVTNALKHGQATHVSIELQQRPTHLHLLVTDNGSGFDYARTQQLSTSGVGLKSLEARVSLLNARLRVDSAPGRGTRIEVEVPLPG